MRRAFVFVLLLSACAKKPATPPKPPPLPGDAQALAAAAGLTEQKVAAFNAYLRALAPTIDAAHLEGVPAVALPPSGLANDEVTALAHLWAAYNRAEGLGILELNQDLAEVRRRIEGAQSHGKKPAPTDLDMAGSIQDHLDKLESQKAAHMGMFVATYGQPAADLLAAHHDAYQIAAQAITDRKRVASSQRAAEAAAGRNPSGNP
jgi:hypothetical protein